MNYSSSKIDGLIYSSSNTKVEGMNIVLRKELIDSGTLYCDIAVMYVMQRNPSIRKNVYFGPASNETRPDHNGNLRFTTII